MIEDNASLSSSWLLFTRTVSQPDIGQFTVGEHHCSLGIMATNTSYNVQTITWTSHKSFNECVQFR